MHLLAPLLLLLLPPHLSPSLVSTRNIGYIWRREEKTLVTLPAFIFAPLMHKCTSERKLQNQLSPFFSSLCKSHNISIVRKGRKDRMHAEIESKSAWWPGPRSNFHFFVCTFPSLWPLSPSSLSLSHRIFFSFIDAQLMQSDRYILFY